VIVTNTMFCASHWRVLSSIAPSGHKGEGAWTKCLDSKLLFS